MPVIRGQEGSVAPDFDATFQHQSGPLRNSSYVLQRILPEDRQAGLDLIRRLLAGTGNALKIIDLGGRWSWNARRKARRAGWKSFPVLVGPYGRMVTGDRLDEETVRDVLEWGPEYAPPALMVELEIRPFRLDNVTEPCVRSPVRSFAFGVARAHRPPQPRLDV